MSVQHNKIPETFEQYHISILSFDGIDLVMPQSDIVSIESLHELSSQFDNPLSIGKLKLQGKDVPVFCFSENMDFLTYHPVDRVQCVIIKYNTVLFGIVCCELQNKVLNTLCIEDIPPLMQKINMPITHFCLYKASDSARKFGLVTDADALNHYIEMVLNKPV